MKKYLLLTLVGALLAGCNMAPLKGGRSVFTSPSLTGELQQSENPKDESTQDLDRVTESEIPIKPGDKITSTDKDGKLVTIEATTPSTVKVRTTEKLRNRIGAAQKDPVREIAAKLGALKGVVWVGVLLFVFGAASAVYPPLKLIVGSLTTSAVCAASGLALIVLPSLIVGNEVLILCIGVGVAGIYWFAHRHGHLHGELKTLKSKIQ
jgi:hypothetical protein